VLSFWSVVYEKSRLCHFQLDRLLQNSFGGIQSVTSLRENLVWGCQDGVVRLFNLNTQ
jgi:hypothetical protein